MSGYRDDLTAAHARIASLERELADARATIEKLESPPPAPAPKPRPPKPPRQVGKLTFVPPRTWFPLLGLLRVAAPAAYRIRPKVGSASGSLLMWILTQVVWRTIVWCWFPLYLVALTVFVLPWAAAAFTALSIVLIPLIFLSRIHVGADPPASGSGWLQDEPSEEHGLMSLWVLLSVTMPVALPLFIPLLSAAQDD
jgi:hypothetical protein